MKNVDFENVRLTGGFWKKRQDLNRNTTIHAVYDRFDDSGRIRAFKCDWKEGMPDQPHFFWDSDVAKWMESAAYLIAEAPDAGLEAAVDSLVDDIAANQFEDGYFNIYYTVVEPGKRFTDRNNHELYCCGHLIEAAVAYYKATGKDKFLNCMKKYVDLIDRVFRVEHSAEFTTPGHEEIELALMKLYDLTGDEKYRTLSMFFIDNRGSDTAKNEGKAYQIQSHVPVREQKEAVGHAVRAVYLYSAMADLAASTGDEGLRNACFTLFDSVVNHRMYITGGIGASSGGEAFAEDYYLPNHVAYTESCAAIGLIFFCRRMQVLDPDNPVYADTIERTLYNGFLSNLSIDGKHFFYENPLEIPPKYAKSATVHYPITQRVEIFWCSCCPPNITRLLASLGNYFYSVNNDTVYVQQFGESTADIDVSGRKVRIEQKTDYPYNGKVEIKVSGGSCRLAVRVPFWCNKYRDQIENGYLRYNMADGDALLLDFEMKPEWVEANEMVNEDVGREALMFGPKIFVMEAVDNGEKLRAIRIRGDEKIEIGFDEELGEPVLFAPARRKVGSVASGVLYGGASRTYTDFKAKFIPYHTFANRGESEMLMWTVVD